MGKIKRYEDMEVWISARALVRRIYAISSTPNFPKIMGCAIKFDERRLA